MRKLTVSADSTTGLRDNNEDAYLVDNRRRFYAVADGVGGLAFGEIASQVAMSAAKNTIESHRPLSAPTTLTKRVFENVSQRFHRNFRHLNMATTLVTIAFDQRKKWAVIGNVGDSRAYRLRKGKLIQLTEDDNIDGVLTGAIATDRSTKPDLVEADVAVGDVFILCSDGVSNELSNGLIQHILMETTAAFTPARRLIKATYTEGEGRDNATAIVIRVNEHVTKIAKS